MFYYGYDPTYILVIIGFLITLIAQIFVNSSYKKYKKVNVKSGLKGFEVARKMLDSNGLTNVKIEECQLFTSKKEKRLVWIIRRLSFFV